MGLNALQACSTAMCGTLKPIAWPTWHDPTDGPLVKHFRGEYARGVQWRFRDRSIAAPYAVWRFPHACGDGPYSRPDNCLADLSRYFSQGEGFAGNLARQTNRAVVVSIAVLSKVSEQPAAFSGSSRAWLLHESLNCQLSQIGTR